MAHPLHGYALDKAAVEQWQRDQQAQPRSRVDAVLEAAVNDPIGLSILARRVVLGESYDQAVTGVCRVTHQKMTVGAAKVRIHRLTRSLAASVLE